MLNQLATKNKVTIVQKQLVNALLLKSNTVINNKIQIRNFSSDSNSSDKNKAQAKTDDSNETFTSKYEPVYDEELDNPKPLDIFENVKKEAETDKIKNRIYAFPNVREEIFKGVKKIKMKEILLNELVTDSFEKRIISPENNTTKLEELPYIYNQHTLNEIQLVAGGLLDESIKNHIKYIPSQSSRLLLLSCPIKGSEIYLKHIASHTAKQLGADFLEITHGDIFYRISGNVMKSMPNIETVEMERNRNNSDMDHQSKFGRKGDPTIFPNVFSMFGGDKRHYERSSSTKIPYPIYKAYEDSKGNTSIVVNRNMPWPKRNIELNVFIQDMWIKLFSKITEEAKSKKIVIFFEDLLTIFNGSLDNQDIFDGLVTVLGITGTFNNVVLIAPSTPTFEKKVVKNNIRFGNLYDEVVAGFKAPDIDAEPEQPKNKMYGDKNAIETKKIVFDTVLDKFVGANVIPVFPAFEKETEFENFRKIISDDLRKLVKKYNIKELNVAARAANCELPLEELENLKGSDQNSLYLEEKLLNPSEIERLLLVTLAKSSSSNEKSRIDQQQQQQPMIKKIQIEDITSADKVLFNTYQSQQFIKDGLEYLNVFKNPKDRYSLNKYENRILKECFIFPSDIKTNFSSIGGLKKTKVIMNELITLPLKRPELFKTGILKETTTGILLFGPPGTGKTLTARAVASQCGANFLNIQMSNIQSKWVGENEKNVKAIFSLARKLAPCVLFIDEIDALLQTRKGEFTPHYMVNTLNEFMQEWDGLNSQNDGVIVIGATNRPFDLDEAVLRRLPRRIFVSLPDAESRSEILDILLKEETVGYSKEERKEILDYVAGKTNQWSGSDLKNLCIATVMNAIKQQIIDPGKQNEVCRTIEKQHFDMAFESGDIVPSLNEKTGIIIQLQEWNTKYGTGADAGGYCGHSSVFGF
ncbi:AAA-domain-containing protein [Piromyces finnis]|uniref:AAA-domain-containing protein n=1 Tax=Piromyces finnis TaxID=1754191 RepID=A0A1Y1V733_9FUNG|nr:AAA-domain-containing protein [Piromyces finnis]|eukprot:ORX48936.1 AAA-domain-containing protein [Piromyces finnis]